MQVDQPSDVLLILWAANCERISVRSIGDVTQWWFRGEPDPAAAQAEVYGRLVADCVALAACRGITVWGVTDADTFMDQTFPWSVLAPNRPLLFDGAAAPKPAYFAVRDAMATRVPEPDALAAGAAALFALAGTRRRRRRRTCDP